jgi:hypothetical protein
VCGSTKPDIDVIIVLETTAANCCVKLQCMKENDRGLVYFHKNKMNCLFYSL